MRNFSLKLTKNRLAQFSCVVPTAKKSWNFHPNFHWNFLIFYRDKSSWKLTLLIAYLFVRIWQSSVISRKGPLSLPFDDDELTTMSWELEMHISKNLGVKICLQKCILLSYLISISISRYSVDIVSISYRNWKKWYRFEVSLALELAYGPKWVGTEVSIAI